MVLARSAAAVMLSLCAVRAEEVPGVPADGIVSSDTNRHGIKPNHHEACPHPSRDDMRELWYVGTKDCLHHEHLVDANPAGSRLAHRCFQSGVRKVTCFFSSAKLNPGAPCRKDCSRFFGRDMARHACHAIDHRAELATITTEEENREAAELVSSIREPHWLYANNPKGEAIEWLDGARMRAGFEAPWDPKSKQPNDCTGPDSEQCVFLGPNAKWFDFNCEPYDPEVATNQYNGEAATPGPEILWEDGEKTEHDVAALCKVEINNATAGNMAIGWMQSHPGSATWPDDEMGDRPLADRDL